MKKIFAIGIIAFIGLSSPSFAQSKTEKAAQGVKKGTGKAWQGTKEEIFRTDNEAVTDFVYSSNLFKKVREAVLKG